MARSHSMHDWAIRCTTVPVCAAALPACLFGIRTRGCWYVPIYGCGKGAAVSTALCLVESVATNAIFCFFFVRTQCLFLVAFCGFTMHCTCAPPSVG